MRFVIACAVALIAFWAAYDLCSFRYSNHVIAPSARSGQLRHANIFLRMADLIDRGETAKPRRKLLATAHAGLITPTIGAISARDLMSWPGIVGLAMGPLEDYRGGGDYIGRENAALEAAVSHHPRALCASSSDADSKEYWCEAVNQPLERP